MSRLVIDPVTRIGGHLRVEVDVSDGVVTDAWSSGTVFRGMELILKDRDPRDAWLFAHRICGTCSSVHALASVRAIEHALLIAIPTNARILRNLLAGAAASVDHALGFYLRELVDWVDVPAALDADPTATSKLASTLSDWPDSSAKHFREVQARLAANLQSGQLGSFANGYWGHPAYRLPPEADLLFMAHYLEAIDWQRRVSRVQTILGGKDPHPQTYLVGGMAVTPPWGGPIRAVTGEHPQLPERTAPDPLSTDGLAEIQGLLAETGAFVDKIYVPDAMAIASFHDDWFSVGHGPGNYLSFGEYPEGDVREARRLLPAGRIVDGDLASVHPIDQAAIAETVAHSWYEDDGDPSPLHPADGETRPHYSGPALPINTLEGADRYSWLKAPRYDEIPMEVGPLARMLVAYAEGRTDVQAAVDDQVNRLGLTPASLMSTSGRIVARAIEAQLIASHLQGWLNDLRDQLESGDLAVADVTRWDPGSWPSEASGWSIGEGPRGAVGHWVSIGGERIQTYQVVDATTWNASPRDAHGRRGPLEEALIGTPVVDPARPLEILRTVHSFEPCTACAVHAVGLERGGHAEIRVARGAS